MYLRKEPANWDRYMEWQSVAKRFIVQMSCRHEKGCYLHIPWRSVWAIVFSALAEARWRRWRREDTKHDDEGAKAPSTMPMSRNIVTANHSRHRSFVHMFLYPFGSSLHTFFLSPLRHCAFYHSPHISLTTTFSLV